MFGPGGPSQSASAQPPNSRQTDPTSTLVHLHFFIMRLLPTKSANRLPPVRDQFAWFEGIAWGVPIQPGAAGLRTQLSGQTAPFPPSPALSLCTNSTGLSSFSPFTRLGTPFTHLFSSSTPLWAAGTGLFLSSTPLWMTITRAAAAVTRAFLSRTGAFLASTRRFL